MCIARAAASLTLVPRCTAIAWLGTIRLSAQNDSTISGQRKPSDPGKHPRPRGERSRRCKRGQSSLQDRFTPIFGTGAPIRFARPHPASLEAKPLDGSSLIDCSSSDPGCVAPHEKCLLYTISITFFLQSSHRSKSRSASKPAIHRTLQRTDTSVASSRSSSEERQEIDKISPGLPRGNRDLASRYGAIASHARHDSGS